MTDSLPYAISLTVHAERVASPRWLGDERRGTGRLVRAGDWLVTWPGGAMSAVSDEEWQRLRGQPEGTLKRRCDYLPREMPEWVRG